MGAERFRCVICGVLDSGAIDRVIHRAQSEGFQEATVRDGGTSQSLPMIRNNERVEWDDCDLAAMIWSRVRGSVPAMIDDWVARGIHDHWKVYRYQPGQRFNAHRDGRVRLDGGIESRLTLLVSLRVADGGGQTAFYHDRDGVDRRGELDESISLGPGDAVLFDHKWWHEGQRVTAGEKLILRSDVLYAPSTGLD